MLKGSRWVYLAASGLFLLGVVTQVFLAGMVVVASRMSWNNHIGLGHTLAGPLLFMLISMYLGRLPGPVKRLTWILFAVYILQADVLIFLRASGSCRHLRCIPVFGPGGFCPRVWLCCGPPGLWPGRRRRRLLSNLIW